MKHLIQVFRQILFPLKCLGCGIYLNPRECLDHGEYSENTLSSCFCPACLEKAGNVQLIQQPFCTRCGLPFKGSGEGHVCQECIQHPLSLGKVRAVAQYQGIIRQAVPQFKYQGALALARVLEAMLFDTFLEHFSAPEISEPDLIVPIPLHTKRLRERGFNQAYLLVRHFPALYKARYHSAPPWQIDLKSLKRTRATDSQTGLDIKARRKNLGRAFQITRPEAIQDCRILLVDDVFTTGATCDEAAGQLLSAGAARVDALVLARA